MLAIALPTAAEILNGCTEGKGELGKQAVAMDALHEKSVKAFPAPSRGRGNQLMQPRRQGELKIYALTCSEIDWEEAGRITMHGYTLNGKSFPATDPVVAKLGQTVGIRFMNEGMMIHPMHRGMLGMVTALVVQPAIG